MSRLNQGLRRLALMSMPQVKPSSVRKLGSTKAERTKPATKTNELSTATPPQAHDAQPATSPNVPSEFVVSQPGAPVPSSSSSSQTQQHGSLLDQINAPSDLKKLSPD